MTGAASIASAVHQALLEARATVAVAESLTGGALGAALTAVPGASRSFRGGVIAYATDVKASVLGVPADLLAERGAVNPEVAAAMATAARAVLGATYGVALTGVAGPQPQDGRSPGTVFVAVAGPHVPPVVTELALPGGRADVRTAAVCTALDLLLTTLSDPRGTVNYSIEEVPATTREEEA